MGHFEKAERVVTGQMAFDSFWNSTGISWKTVRRGCVCVNVQQNSTYGVYIYNFFYFTSPFFHRNKISLVHADVPWVLLLVFFLLLLSLALWLWHQFIAVWVYRLMALTVAQDTELSLKSVVVEDGQIAWAWLQVRNKQQKFLKSLSKIQSMLDDDDDTWLAW